MADYNLSLAEAEKLAVRALTHHRVSPENAASVARALVAAEADGLKGHGLSRLPSYCGQSASGKVDGFAVPAAVKAVNAAIRVDACNGFAYPALDLAKERLVELTAANGIAAAAVFNSHHCGVAGHHVEGMARKGMCALLFANTPKAIAPWGGSQGIYGTNPIAFAAPRPGAAPLVIDLSLSKVARGKIMFAQQEGTPIPEGWALDPAGNPTTDPNAALNGTMLPMGGAKGAALVMMVEILAAALTAANFGFEASSFFSADGPPPGVGQLLIALAPGPMSGGGYESRIAALTDAVLGQGNTRLPGDRRLALRQQAQGKGLQLTRQQYEQLMSLCP
jgi:(2R)-3-sulfolactate dehydrogenase (NADP+)